MKWIAGIAAVAAALATSATAVAAPYEPVAPRGAAASPGATTAQGPRLTLRTGKTDMVLGQRTRAWGRLSGVRDVSRRRITLEIDVWPFGTFRRAARATTDRRGRFGFIGRPQRNHRLRARIGSLHSAERTVWVDYPGRVRVRGGGTRRPRISYRLWVFRKAKVRQKRVYAYLAGSKAEPWRLVASRGWTHRGRRSVATTLRYPPGRLGRRDHWMLCLPEPTPDAFGRPTEVERRCGAPEIPRGI